VLRYSGIDGIFMDKVMEWNGEGYKGIKSKEGERGRPSKLSKGKCKSILR